MGLQEIEDKILGYIRENGPSLPVSISKEIDRSILMASAILSGMVNERKLLSTRQKIGSSNQYYLPEQEEQVKQGLVKSMDDIEESAFKELKTMQIFRDDKLTPRQRVFVRKFRDFFNPTDNQGQVIWSYYTVQKDELEEFLKKEPKKQINLDKTQVISEPSLNLDPSEKPEQEEKKELPPLKFDFGKEEQKKTEDSGPKTFFQKVKNYFESKNIVIKDVQVMKKDREINLTVVFESVLGKHVYFVKAINKKRLNESDLALAWTESSGKGMPCILLTNGDFTSSAKKFYKENLKNFVLIKEIE